MKRLLSTALLLLAAAAPSFAQSYFPVVENPAPEVVVPLGTTRAKVKFKTTFSLSGLTGPVVRFSTSAGNIDVALLSDKAPNTVNTFLKYAQTPGNNGAGTYTYNNTLLQRAVPGFVVQGGGYFVDADESFNQIVGRPAIKGEPGVSNTRGTLAMALSNGPDSGTGDFFFNVADNNSGNGNLDTTVNGGPFTVFGKVIQGLGTLDAIEALPNRDLSSQLGGSFQTVPLINYDGVSNVKLSNLVYLNSITSLPLLPAHNGLPAVLKLKTKGNTNPDLVTSMVVDGKKIILGLNPGVTGSSTITIVAKDAAKNKATTSFVVTVQ